MKRMLLIIVHLIITLSLTVGCFPGGTATRHESDNNSSPTVSQNHQTDKSTSGLNPPVKLVWYWNASDVQVPENGYIVKRIQQDLNITYVHVKPSSNNYEEKLNLMLASGEQLDIIGATGALKVRLIDDSIFIPIDEYINDHYIGNVIRISSGWDKAFDAVKMPDGSRYTVPVCINNILAASCFIRYDWLKNLKLEVPATYEELANVLTKFTNNDPDRNGRNDTWGTVINEMWGALEYAINLGCSYDEYYRLADGRICYWMFHPRSREWVRYIQELVETGAASPEILTTTFPQACELVKAGKVGFLWSYNEVGYNDEIRKIQPDCDWNIMPPPRGIYDEGFYGANNLIINEYGITASCKNIDSVFRLMNYFADDASTEGMYDFSSPYYAMKLGERGVNWDVVNGAIDTGAISEKFAEQNRIDNWVGLAGNFWSQFDTSWILNTSPAYQEYRKKHASMKTRYDIPSTHPAAPLDRRLIQESAEISRFYTEQFSRFQEYFGKAVLRKVDVDEGYDGFIRDAEKEGLDKYTDEITRLYKILDGT